MKFIIEKFCSCGMHFTSALKELEHKEEGHIILRKRIISFTKKEVL